MRSLFSSAAAESIEDEEFDHSFITNIEAHVYPNLGHPRIPEEIISNLGKVLQHASKIHEPQPISSLPSVDDLSEQMSPASFDEDFSSKTRKGFDDVELLDVVGLTVHTNVLPRERFSYWCFDLLVLLCSQNAIGMCTQALRTIANCN